MVKGHYRTMGELVNRRLVALRFFLAQEHGFWRQEWWLAVETAPTDAKSAFADCPVARDSSLRDGRRNFSCPSPS